MRDRVAALKKIIRVLSMRMEEKGDLAYYKRKNTELQAQLLSSQKEIIKLTQRLNDLQRTVEELREIIVSGGDLPSEDKATSPMESLRKRTDGKFGAKGSVRGRKKDVVYRPPLKGVSAPIHVRERDIATNSEDVEAVLNKEIADLVARRREIRSAERSTDPSPAVNTRNRRAPPRIIINILSLCRLYPPPP